MANDIKDPGSFTQQCVVEVPPSFIEQLQATMEVTFYEVPSHTPVTIIDCNQKYVIEVCMTLTAVFRSLYCGKWCINISVENCGPAADFYLGPKYIEMTPCPRPGDRDCVTFELPGSIFKTDVETCGQVIHLCITAMALDSCKPPKPIGICGYCEVGPLMVCCD